MSYFQHRSIFSAYLDISRGKHINDVVIFTLWEKGLVFCSIGNICSSTIDEL